MLRSFMPWRGKFRRKSGPNIIVKSVFGPMIISLNDRYVSSEIRSSGAWELSETKFILRLAEFLISQYDRILFYDIGANLGQHSLALATTFKDKMRIRAFEPQPPIFKMLCGTMALNNIRNVSCECALVGEEHGKLVDVLLPDYNAPNNFGGFEFIKAKYSDNQNMKLGETSTTVHCVTVDSFHEHVHLMKIDVEGMEECVLKGAAQVISESRPVCWIETMKSGEEPIRSFFDQFRYRVISRGANVIAAPKEHLSNLAFLEMFPKT